MATEQPIFRTSHLVAARATLRAGIKERLLVSADDSPYQNVVIIDAEHGAEVEMHQIIVSESLFVLSGTFEVELPDSSRTLEAGDFCYFPAKTSHGLRCIEGRGQFLVVFAPSKHSMGK